MRKIKATIKFIKFNKAKDSIHMLTAMMTNNNDYGLGCASLIAFIASLKVVVPST